MVQQASRTGRYSPLRRGQTPDLFSFQKVSDDAQITWLEKGGQKGGVTTQEQIASALDEYARLFKAGIASPAEKFTLARAFPDAPSYVNAISKLDSDSIMVVGGPASVEMVDKEGHLITTNALSKAFDKYMDNFRTRNAMVLHSDVQVGWALPAYITKGGQIYKSGINGKELFFITELRDDTKIAERVSKQIDDGKLRSYSIAGSATKVQNVSKGATPYMQVDDMELAEVTVCEKGVNAGASFQILKAQTGKISKDQCGYRPATDIEIKNSIMCGTCKYFNKDDKTCDTVDGVFEDTDYCKLFEQENGEDDPRTEKHPALIASKPKIKVRLILSDDGEDIMFNKTLQELVQNPEWSTAEVQTQRDWWDWDLNKQDRHDVDFNSTFKPANKQPQQDDLTVGSFDRTKPTPTAGRGTAVPTSGTATYGQSPNKGANLDFDWSSVKGLKDGGTPESRAALSTATQRAQSLKPATTTQKTATPKPNFGNQEVSWMNNMEKSKLDSFWEWALNKQEGEEWVSGKGFPSQEGIHPYNQKRQGYIHPSNRPDAKDPWRPEINDMGYAGHDDMISEGKRLNALSPYERSQSIQPTPWSGESASMQGRPGQKIRLDLKAGKEPRRALAEMSAQARRQRVGRGEFAGYGGLSEMEQRQEDYMPSDPGKFSTAEGWEKGVDAWDPRTGIRGRMRPSHAEQLAAENPETFKRINPHLRGNFGYPTISEDARNRRGGQHMMYGYNPSVNKMEKSNIDTFKQWMEEQS